MLHQAESVVVTISSCQGNHLIERSSSWHVEPSLSSPQSMFMAIDLSLDALHGRHRAFMLMDKPKGPGPVQLM